MHLRCDVEIPVNEYKQHLRRLALHDDALLNAIAAEGSSFPASVIDAKSAALVRVAATIAVDAALASLRAPWPSRSQPARRATRSSPPWSR